MLNWLKNLFNKGDNTEERVEDWFAGGMGAIL